ncbi:MAG: hypothetical protein Gaeavirus3_14 [Gaeavirus sp.]|uniref:Uncharacterized protein n=1 Tax=Gaeavirus sp. TaxID=2487767 RepID=A0A3G4ZYM1_9VIRU|nr:MAG: hypothetical protein Gaeavirus3_14 [Gaeavirus sp.]
MKRPPDIYVTSKCSLTSIIRNKSNIDVLLDAANRTNQLVIHAYQFLRLWILDKYHHNKNIDLIDHDLISMAFKALSIDSNGPKPKDDNLRLYNEFKTFFDDVYSKLECKLKNNSKNLSKILQYSATEMITSIENNIKNNFVKYVKKFVNSSYSNQIIEITVKLEGKTKTKKKKELFTELSLVKDDLLCNTLKSDKKYHQWILTNRPKLIPPRASKIIDDDIQINPQGYIKSMIFMCLEIENITIVNPPAKKINTVTKVNSTTKNNFIAFNETKAKCKSKTFINVSSMIKDNGYLRRINRRFKRTMLKQRQMQAKFINPSNNIKKKVKKSNTNDNNHKVKSFQFFPLRTSSIVKYIKLDTSAIIDLLVKGTKEECLKNIKGNKHALWNTFFNLDNPIFTQNTYKFDHKISTDCKTVSIQLIHKDHIKSKEIKQDKIVAGRATVQLKKKAMTPEQLTLYKANQKIKNIENKMKLKTDAVDKAQTAKDEYNKLQPDEKLKVRKELQKKSHEEFPYLTELTDIQLTDLKKNDWVVCDPGRRTLFYMKSKDGTKTFRYTNKTHVQRTKRLKYQTLIKNHKNKLGITKIEEELSKFNSKTCKLVEFKNYIQNKNKANVELFKIYKSDYVNKTSGDKFRKYKWYSYINQKRTVAKLNRKIKQKFGKDNIIVMGDWSASSNSSIKYISTPNIGLKRSIAKSRTIYSIDEFRTSCLNYLPAAEKSKKLYLPDKNQVLRKLYPVLTYKTESKTLGCINRDENAVRNMINITSRHIEKQALNKRYCRSYDLKKDSNQSMVKCCHVVRCN